MSVKGIAHEIEKARLDLSGLSQLTGSLDASGHRFAIVAARFNHHLTGQLAEDAVEVFTRHGARLDDIELVWVPGSFEIPLTLDRLAQRNVFSAMLALGVVIEGETPHADLITREVTRSLHDLGRIHQVPVIDGVVATRNEEQARVRCTRGEDSRGSYAARAAIEMAVLFRTLADPKHASS